MITPDKIFDTIQKQCPFFASFFAQDPPLRGTQGLNIFHSTVIVPQSEAETEPICLEIISEKFCLLNTLTPTGATEFAKETYLRIKRLAEEAVGNKLLERNISTVIGKDRSCLYGAWAVTRSDDWIHFTCRVNLTGVRNASEVQLPG